ncbi:MAG: flippase-like domain-containing protein [Chloroflexi bacterium]|nr:flippase-like domain-containing protein [Chloroflexota bacterium]
MTERLESKIRNPQSAIRKWAVVLPWVVAVGLLALALRTISLAEVWATLRRLSLGGLAVLSLVNGLVLVSLNGRWWIILRAQGHTIPFFKLFGYRLAAFGVSYFTPGPHFGGEPVQVALVERRHGVPRATAVAAVALDKSLELLVNFFFLVVGVLVIMRQRLFGAMVDGTTAVLPIVLLAVPFLFLAATWRGWYPVTWGLRQMARLPWPWRARWQPRADRLLAGLQASEAQATLFCQSSPAALTAALLVSLLSWLLLIVEYGLMLRFLGLELTAVQTIALLTAARIAYLLPLPGGLGTLEASQVLTLTLLGLDPAAGLSASLLIRARDVLLGVLGLWWGGRQWRK